MGLLFVRDMDVFTKSPTEIVLCILHYTVDFVGVDSLLDVSPCVREIFEANTLLITEGILAGCRRILEP